VNKGVTAVGATKEEVRRIVLPVALNDRRCSDAEVGAAATNESIDSELEWLPAFAQ